MMELKHWMSTDDLFAAENQTEKVHLMRQAWDMGKDPLVIMRSSPHSVRPCPEPDTPFRFSVLTVKPLRTRVPAPTVWRWNAASVGRCQVT